MCTKVTKEYKSVGDIQVILLMSLFMYDKSLDIVLVSKYCKSKPMRMYYRVKQYLTIYMFFII
jgi:hypothetical protein